MFRVVLKVLVSVIVFVLLFSGVVVVFWMILFKEFELLEDCGKFFVFVCVVEGINYDEMIIYIDEIEEIFMDYIENGEV